MSATTTSIDPECQILGEVEMVERNSWEKIRRRATPGLRRGRHRRVLRQDDGRQFRVDDGWTRSLVDPLFATL